MWYRESQKLVPPLYGVEGLHDRPPGSGDDPDFRSKKIPGGSTTGGLYDLFDLAQKAKTFLDALT